MKKLISLILALALCVSLAAAAGAAEPNDESAPSAPASADALNILGLFQGTDNGYELDRAPTRLEALIMYIRLTGMENEALYFGEYESPFEDTPAWYGASQYLGYAHINGLADGVSKAPNGDASAYLYLSFVLKALGYADKDISYEWAELSKAAGLFDADSAAAFTRGDMVNISLSALNATVQGEDVTLAEKLVSNGVFSELSLAAARAKTGKTAAADSALLDIAGMLYANSDTVSTSRLFANPITGENLSAYFGEAELDIADGLACEPLMTASAHSVCLVRLKDGADVEKAKSDIAANADPRKWICVGVEPENVRVENVGNLVLLVMDDNDPDGLVQAFKSLG